ncbi:hypothetical protein BBD42_04995 [Paenibacillus sp. BIHB 4019]|uniref:ABC transporter substrate-binding protein n=1 Tax=Paenibacillus sp. BIHB 4019 TaxID=1870819 RepID=A0A1B2DDX0_9BACL|nr:ABC transporter substrate-binding protein [Paenibacillus sp. BIHB 4019]ANY65896.1 hypothetical protein BBD42_04995 [Paenibacillus sp. BIHB 4019]
MKRKMVSFSIALLLLTSVILSACSSGNNDNKPAETGGKAELRFAWWGSEERHTATLEAIKIFESKNPDIKILPEYSGFDGYQTKLQAQLAGNTAPDLIQVTRDIATQLGGDNLLDLQGKLDVSGLNETILKEEGVGGKITGAYLGLATQAYAYNKTLLEELGVKAPTAPYTWDDLATVFKEVAEKSGGKVYGAVDSSVAFDVFIPFGIAALNAKDPFPNTDTALTFTEDQIKAYYQYWADLRAAKAVAPADLSATSDDSANSLMITRKAAFVPIATSSFSRFQSQTKDVLDMIVLPQNKETGDSVKVGTSQLLSVNANSKNPDAAIKFINFMIYDTDAAKVLKTTRGVLPTEVQRKVLLEDPSLTETDKRGITIIDEATKLTGPPAYALPKGPQLFGWKGMIEKVGQEIAFDRISVEVGAKKLYTDAYKAYGTAASN